MTAPDNKTLLEFPCRYSVKAFGAGKVDFEQLVYHIVKAHVPELTPDSVRSRQSSGGRFLAVTATFQATSKAQLDAIYHDLSADDRVVMSL